MDAHEIPVKPRKPGKHVLTDGEKEYLKGFAVDGEIPFNDYIRAVNKVLNQ